MKENNPVDTIYNHVKRKIITKVIFPGNRIIEEDLTKEVGGSRTSVRTALAKLKNEGFVDSIPNKGTYVIKPLHEEIQKAFEVRLYLEIGAITLAIPNMTEEAIQRMEDSMIAQRKLKDNFSITEYAILNRAFHEEIVHATHNEYYEKFLNEIYNKVHLYMIFYDTSRDNTGSLVSHQAIVDAIKARDIEAGIKATRLDNKIGITDIDDSNVCRINLE